MTKVGIVDQPPPTIFFNMFPFTFSSLSFFSGGSRELLAPMGGCCVCAELKGWTSGICQFLVIVSCSIPYCICSWIGICKYSSLLFAIFCIVFARLENIALARKTAICAKEAGFSKKEIEVCFKARGVGSLL